MSDVKKKDQRDILKVNDILTYEPGGTHIDNLGKILLQNPHFISEKVTETSMVEMIGIILHEEYKLKIFRKNYKMLEIKSIQCSD